MGHVIRISLFVYSYYYAAMERQYLPKLDPSESVCTCNESFFVIVKCTYTGDDKIG